MRMRALFLALRSGFSGSFSWPVVARPQLLLALLVSGLLASCGTTPTLPLPPPVASIGAPSLQGLVTVEGQANEDAYITVLNQDTRRGKITQAEPDGHFSLEIEAETGDVLVIWQERDGDVGERTEQTVPEGTR